MEALAALGVFLVGVVLIERGADLFVERVGNLAERTRLSPTLLGLLTVGVEWEELAVAIVAAASGHVGVAVGAIIGANIANLAGSFSLGLLARPIPITRSDRLAMGAMLVATVVAAGLLRNGLLESGDGAALVGLFVLYVAALALATARGLARWKVEPGDEPPSRGIAATAALTFLGLGLLIAGAELVIHGATSFARTVGVPEVVIGLTLVSVGTTLPDKVVSVVGARRGQGGIVVANAAGSNICNLLLVLGLAALVQPLTVDEAVRSFDLPVLVGLATLVTLLALRTRLGRAEGALLLAVYAGYLAYHGVGTLTR
ncbi:MAG TPA: sodium:calcium antiporter [Chloroflexota bacterium]